MDKRIKKRKLSEDPPEELQFEEDRLPPRAGDPLPRSKVAKEFPPRRVREAGLTGGSAGHATADDASPETLLDEDHDRAVDEALRQVDASDIGGGYGKDEAELARQKPEQPEREARSLAKGATDRGPGRMHSRNAARRTGAHAHGTQSHREH